MLASERDHSMIIGGRRGGKKRPQKADSRKQGTAEGSVIPA
jgi:hypothetical protein